MHVAQAALKVRHPVAHSIRCRTLPWQSAVSASWASSGLSRSRSRTWRHRRCASCGPTPRSPGLSCKRTFFFKHADTAVVHGVASTGEPHGTSCHVHTLLLSSWSSSHGNMDVSLLLFQHGLLLCHGLCQRWHLRCHRLPGILHLRVRANQSRACVSWALPSSCGQSRRCSPPCFSSPEKPRCFSQTSRSSQWREALRLGSSTLAISTRVV